MANFDNRPSRLIQQQMGRDDPDLTPAHDRAMFWLDQWVRENLLTNHAARRPIFDDISLPEVSWEARDLASYRTLEELEQYVGQPCPDCQPGTLDRIEWEYPMRGGWLFLDLVATVSQSLPSLSAMVRPKWSMRTRTWLYGFEVKPELYSIGVVLRQLKVYAMFFTGEIALVAPANPEWEEVIRREGFGYFDLPDHLRARPTYWE